MKVKIFSSSEDEKLEDQVNAWLKEHTDIEIVKSEFGPVAGSDFTYASCCIWYRELQTNEYIKGFSAHSFYDLEKSYHNWIDQNGDDIEIISRHYSTSAISNTTDTEVLVPEYSYLIVYK